jgi:hypothetical protein
MQANDSDQAGRNPASGQEGLDSLSDEEFFSSGPAAVLPPHFDERELQMRADYEWCLRDAAIQRQYAGRVVAANRQRIWGAGNRHGDALREALQTPGCPPREELALVYIEGCPLISNA